MKISKWITGVATGRIRHWNDHNNQLVSNLWGETEEYKEPTRTAFQGALVSSLQAVERMLGPEVGKDGWMAVDLSDVSGDTFEHVYAVLLDMFLVLDANAVPSLAGAITDPQTTLFGRSSVVEKYIVALSDDASGIQGVADLAWRELSSILNPSKATDTLTKFSFVALVIKAATENIKQLR